MRNRIVALLLAAMLALSAAAAAAPQGGADFLVYETAAHGFRVHYPSDWQLAEGVMGTVVLFSSPLDSSEDRFSENVNVGVEDLAAFPGTTLAKYEEAAIAMLAKVITDFRLVDRRDYAVAGKPAKIIEYSGRQGEFRLRFLQTFLIADNKAYIVTFVAEQAKYRRYEPVAMRMVDSFAVR